jgi:hypothetical protein
VLGKAIAHTTTVSLNVNGTATALSCAIVDPATTCADTTDSVAIPPNSTVALELNFAGGPHPTSALRFAWLDQGGYVSALRACSGSGRH